MYMTRHHTGRFAGLRGRMLIAVAAVLVPLALAGPAAAENHPTGNFAPFKYCPLSNKLTELCTVAETTTGEFTVGKRSVPINKPITLQGGLHENETTGELEFIAAEGAETLSKTALYVPGGLFDILAPEWLNKEAKEKFEKTINEGITGVTATTELAKPASAIKLNTNNLILEEGVALQLPVKVKLGNLFLGNECYVGSEASPIILNLTTGTTSPPAPNKPIKGSAGSLEVLEGGNLVRLNGGSLVDNAWASPGAHGCGGKLFEGVVDEAVNQELGLPSAAGHNTAILGGKLEEALAAAVKASE
jgi:hypothetical protein